MPKICDFTQGMLYSLTEKIQDVYPTEVLKGSSWHWPCSQFHLYLGGLSTTISRRTDAAHFEWPITDDKGQVRDVVKIKEQTLAADHPSRLASQHVLATMFWHLGQHAAALHLMENVVEELRKLLDEDHPNRKKSEAWLRYIQDSMSPRP